MSGLNGQPRGAAGPDNRMARAALSFLARWLLSATALVALSCGSADESVGDTGGSGPADAQLDPVPAADAGLEGGDGVPLDAVSDPGGRADARPDAIEVPGELSLAPESEHGIDGFYLGTIDVADFDGDERPDLVISASWDSAFTPDMSFKTCRTRIRLYRNVSETGGAIHFALRDQIDAVEGCGGSTARVGDFDGDGRPDFAVEFTTRGVDAETAGYFNQGAWEFTRIPLGDFANDDQSLGMAAADVDGDGRDELVFASQTAPGLWYDWDVATRRWVAQQVEFPHAITYGGGIATGDLTGDGRPEMLVVGNSGGPFGNLNCTADANSLTYGQVHRNTGAGFALDPYRLTGNFPWGPVDGVSPPYDRGRALRCDGADNAGVLIADLDDDGRKDIVLAGSSTSFGLPIYDGSELLRNGQQYDLAVLFNVDEQTAFEAWELIGEQTLDGETDGGAGNVDEPNIAVGDLTGDGQLEIFVQGHHRDHTCRERLGEPCSAYYVFESILLLNRGDRTFSRVANELPHVGEGGEAMADFNGDDRVDLIYGGATIPWHSNGANGFDRNTAASLVTYVYRNTR